MTAPALAPSLCEPGLGDARPERLGGSRSDNRQLQHHMWGGPTLDVALTRVWGRVLAHREVACPMCGGAMAPRYSAGPLPVASRCSDCGSVLS